MDKQSYAAAEKAYIASFRKLGDLGFGVQAKVQSALLVTDLLERVAVKQDENPYPALTDLLSQQTRWLESVAAFDAAHGKKSDAASAMPDEAKDTITLFEAAWTTYSDKTYDHSVELIRDRLARNGFDAKFFAGKVCLDGGCGTGRFSVAMAELGARKVFAVDLGGSSLEYLEKVKKRLKLDNIEIVKQDVTDLTRWENGSIDFTVSNGVLHHTVEQERGIKEHFRITRPGGTYWIYLYGAGGMYWALYDLMKESLRSVPVAKVKEILHGLNVREGLIYSFLDNVRCPIRTYYLTSDVVKMLRPLGAFTWKNLHGGSVVDDTEKVLASAYGKELWGPEGEVRIRVDKQ